jgi:hypothetical protein
MVLSVQFRITTLDTNNLNTLDQDIVTTLNVTMTFSASLMSRS